MNSQRRKLQELSHRTLFVWELFFGIEATIFWTGAQIPQWVHLKPYPDPTTWAFTHTTIEISLWIHDYCFFHNTFSYDTPSQAFIKEREILSDFWCSLCHAPGNPSEFSSTQKSLFILWTPQALLYPGPQGCSDSLESWNEGSWRRELQDLSRWALRCITGWAALSPSSF